MENLTCMIRESVAQSRVIRLSQSLIDKTFHLHKTAILKGNNGSTAENIQHVFSWIELQQRMLPGLSCLSHTMLEKRLFQSSPPPFPSCLTIDWGHPSPHLDIRPTETRDFFRQPFMTIYISIRASSSSLVLLSTISGYSLTLDFSLTSCTSSRKGALLLELLDISPDLVLSLTPLPLKFQ